MGMGSERKYMPIIFFFLLCIFVFGIVKLAYNFKSTAQVLSFKDSMCGNMFISDAILIAQKSDCMDVGTLNVQEYECNEDLGRITFPMQVQQLKEGTQGAVCHVFTSSSNTHLQWRYDNELE